MLLEATIMYFKGGLKGGSKETQTKRGKKTEAYRWRMGRGNEKHRRVEGVQEAKTYTYPQ